MIVHAPLILSLYVCKHLWIVLDPLLTLAGRLGGLLHDGGSRPLVPLHEWPIVVLALVHLLEWVLAFARLVE